LRNGLDGLVQRLCHSWSPLLVKTNATPATGVPGGTFAKTRRLFCPTSQARHAKIFIFPKFKIMIKRSHPVHKRDASRSSRFVGGGCDGRVGPQDVRAGAHGQAVWSCPANAGDNPRVEEPGGRWQKSWFTGEITEQPQRPSRR